VSSAPPDPAKEAARRAKQTGYFLKNTTIVALSYVVDGAFLLLLFLAGTVSWHAAVAYTAVGLGSSAVFLLLFRSGWNWRFQDANLTFFQSVVGAAIQLVAMWMWPEVGFVFLLVLFVVFVSGAMRIQVRHALVTWAVVSVVVGLVLGSAPARMRIPDGNLAERLLAWSFFAVTLGRCVFLGTVNTNMRLLVRKRSAELAELTEKVQQLARHDELTGILNRRSLLEILRDEQQRADRSGAPLSVAILDLDFFKAVNDTLGHLAGDKTLKLFSAAVQQLTRGTDRFGRYGGEEFLLVLPGTAAEFAQISTERIRTALSHWDWSEVAIDFRVNFSAGISAYRPGESTEELLARADAALYRAKSAGRNCSRLG
jgi:diguanylate cyclase (GGDEF)-like protein